MRNYWTNQFLCENLRIGLSKCFLLEVWQLADNVLQPMKRDCTEVAHSSVTDIARTAT